MTDDEILARAGEILEQRIKGKPYKINGTKDCVTMIRCKLAGATREKFCCLFLDAKHRVLAFETLFLGSVCNAKVQPREVVWAAWRHNAAAVVFAHNHPSGDAEPSQTDEEMTKRLAEICNELDISVLDHIVVGEDKAVSMAERGML